MFNKHNIETDDLDTKVIKLKPLAVRVKAFGELFGRDPRWVYRLIAKGKIDSIEGYGKTLIPLTEADRILSASRKENL